jgi:hypothetical protein
MYFRAANFMPRRRISVLAVTAALAASGAMLGAAPAGAATTGATGPVQISSGLLGETITVNVPAATGPTGSDTPGVDTGIDLTSGEGATITATGTATCDAPNPSDPCTNLGPDGTGSAVGPHSPPFMDPDAPAFSLDGEVGSGPLTFIGVGPTTLQGTGELTLGYNDAMGAYYNNGGSFTVTIQTCSLYSLPILGPTLCSVLG